MYRICKEISTGKIIEMQSGGSTQEHLNTLKQNAINAGYSEEDITVEWVDGDEFEGFKNLTAELTEQGEKEAMIQGKMREIAISQLIKEGKLADEDHC